MKKYITFYILLNECLQYILHISLLGTKVIIYLEWDHKLLKFWACRLFFSEITLGNLDWNVS